MIVNGIRKLTTIKSTIEKTIKGIGILLAIVRETITMKEINHEVETSRVPCKW